jgi:hypothetical protein
MLLLQEKLLQRGIMAQNQPKSEEYDPFDGDYLQDFSMRESNVSLAKNLSRGKKDEPQMPSTDVSSSSAIYEGGQHSGNGACEMQALPKIESEEEEQSQHQEELMDQMPAQSFKKIETKKLQIDETKILKGDLILEIESAKFLQEKLAEEYGLVKPYVEVKLIYDKQRQYRFSVESIKNRGNTTTKFTSGNAKYGDPLEPTWNKLITHKMDSGNQISHYYLVFTLYY